MPLSKVLHKLGEKNSFPIISVGVMVRGCLCINLIDYIPVVLKPDLSQILGNDGLNKCVSTYM